MNTNIQLGPIRFTPALSIGFVALGFVWACIVALCNRDQHGLTPATATSLSFWFMVIPGVWLFQDLGARFDAALNRLRDRGAIPLTAKQLDQFKRDVQAKSRFAAILGGTVMFLLVVVFYVTAYALNGKTPPISGLLQYPFEAGACFLVGLYMGRTTVHSYFGMLLQKQRVQVTIMPGHPDGAAGMSPIGALFFRQAAILLLPAIYFVGWWTVMTPLNHVDLGFAPDDWERFGQEWSDIYLTMFAVMMIMQLLGFIVPMWLFHVQMQEHKTAQLVVADGLSGRITEIKAQLAVEDDEDRLKTLEHRLSQLTMRHGEIESLPTWPLSLAVRRKFAVSNLIVMLPWLLTESKKIYELLNR